MSSSTSLGWSARICSALMPAPSLRRISSTGMRVPLITGLPPMISGLISIRSWAIAVYAVLPAKAGYIVRLLELGSLISGHHQRFPDVYHLEKPHIGFVGHFSRVDRSGDHRSPRRTQSR